MNILIPHSWLKEYLETESTPDKIANCLSLCGPSVEKINKVTNDSVYDIEITTNRVDAMSVAGLAREAAAILPQFGITAKFKNNPYEVTNKKLKAVSQDKKLKVIIKDNLLCPRFTAVILENITIKASPKLIQDRLSMVGMRSLNNIVDISNYLMHELGQPVHIFDYDKIAKRTMILRESKKGEKITTLDGKKHLLPGGDIVIEDGEGKIIDLCGIMGGQNSAVDENTKTVLLFVQNYEPTHIRKTSMKLAHRTQAATLFEKNLDPELVMPTIIKGIQLIKEVAGGQLAGNIIDLYPIPFKQKQFRVSLQLIELRLGVKINLNQIIKMLQALGFKPRATSQYLTIKIPSWRANDIEIPEDIIEEVARIYGYHNLPSVLPPLYRQPRKPKTIFEWEEKTKDLLKNWGLAETYTYSMQSDNQLMNFDLKIENHLKLKNPLSSEWVYLRTSLTPSILSVIKENLGREEEIKIFELANIYLPWPNNLPKEIPVLNIAFSGEKNNERLFYKVKGICEALFSELKIKGIKYQNFLESGKRKEFIPGRTTTIFYETKNQKQLLGYLGELQTKILINFGIEQKVVIAEVDFNQLASLATNKQTYHPIPKYPAVIEDLSFILPLKTPVDKLINKIKKTNVLIDKVNLINIYKNVRTFKIYYQDKSKPLTAEQVAEIRKNIVVNLQKIGVNLKGTLQ